MSGKALGILVLLRVGVDLVWDVDRIARSLHFGPAIDPLILAVAALVLVLLRVVVRFGVWRLVADRRWAWLALAAFLLSLPGAVASLILFTGVFHESAAVAFSLVWIGLVGEFVFPLALLLTEVVPGWVGLLGMAVVLFNAVRTLAFYVAGNTSAYWFITFNPLAADFAAAAETVFMVALAVSLIRGFGPDAPASNKRIERTPRALS